MLGRDEANLTKTDWSMIAAASAQDGSRGADALEALARRYWPAVYAFLRRSGRNVHEAADLTQGFICDVVIGRRIFDTADPERGRFRTLLLTALRNYVRQEARQENRRRNPRSRPGRGPGVRAGRGRGANRSDGRAAAGGERSKGDGRFAINLGELAAVEPGGGMTPEAAFSAQWSAMLVRHVLEHVRESCVADGLEAHWVIFEHRVVRPMLFGEEPTPYPMLAERLELDDAAKARNMMVTVKRRFATALYVEVCTTVEDSTCAEGELFELLRDLERQ